LASKEDNVKRNIQRVSEKKRGVELFAKISSTVNRFWKFFHCR